MSGAAHLESALQRHAEHRHIADKVQYLMADKFIGKTQSFGVDNAFVADNDGVGEGTAQSQIFAVQVFHWLRHGNGISLSWLTLPPPKKQPPKSPIRPTPPADIRLYA